MADETTKLVYQYRLAVGGHCGPWIAGLNSAERAIQVGEEEAQDLFDRFGLEARVEISRLTRKYVETRDILVGWGRGEIATVDGVDDADVR